MKHLFFLLLIALTSCSSSCNKDKDVWEEIEFEFALPVNITPGTDTVSVGQELIYSASFSDSLFDYVSQKKYYLPNFNFKTVAVVMKLTNVQASVTEQTPAVGKFDFVYDIGSLSNLSTRFADVNYKYEYNKYGLRLKIKAKETGVYIVFFYHSTGTKGQTELPQELAPNVPGFKRFPIMKVLRYTFNNGNTHFNIYKQHCKPADPNETTNWVESKSTYTFVVK